MKPRVFAPRFALLLLSGLCLAPKQSRADAASATAQVPAPVSSVQQTNGTAEERLPLRYVNVRIKPLGLVSGVYGGELQVGFLPRWFALGASIDYFQGSPANNSRTTNVYEYGLLASIYFLGGERFHGGWLLQPGFRYVPVNTTQNLKDSTLTTPTYNYALTLSADYEWAWDSGLNILIGAGLAASPSQSTRLVEPLAVWQLGFAI